MERKGLKHAVHEFRSYVDVFMTAYSLKTRSFTFSVYRKVANQQKTVCEHILLNSWPDLVILHALESLRWMLLICHCQWSHLLQNCRCLDGLRYGMFWVLRTLIWWSMIALGHITCLLHLHELVTQKLCPIGGVLWSENIVSSHILYCPEFLCALIEILTRVVTKWISLWSLILCTCNTIQYTYNIPWSKSVQVNLV